MDDVMNIANLCYLEPVLHINTSTGTKKRDDSKKHPGTKKRDDFKKHPVTKKCMFKYDDNDLEEMKTNDTKTYKRIMKNRRTSNKWRLNRINMIDDLKTENEHIKSENKHLKTDNERYKSMTFVVSFENKRIKSENNDLKTENKRYKNIINKYKRYNEANDIITNF
jgi:hypothetical protein